MPCYDYYPQPTYVDNPETKERLDLVTRLLCSLCKRIESQGHGGDDLITMDAELAEWWEQHKELDRKREAKEHRIKKLAAEKKKLKSRREEILAGLSKEERKILGI